MSAPLPPAAVAADFDYVTTSDMSLRAAGRAAERWLRHGYLASANVSLLVGQRKAGKTTLLSVLSRWKADGWFDSRTITLPVRRSPFHSTKR